MKRALMVFLMLAVACLQGCAAFQSTSTPTQLVVSYDKACLAYAGALTTATDLLKAGKLSATAVTEITKVDKVVTPICTGTIPTDPTAATAQITTAVTTLVADSIVTTGVK